MWSCVLYSPTEAAVGVVYFVIPSIRLMPFTCAAMCVIWHKQGPGVTPLVDDKCVADPWVATGQEPDDGAGASQTHLCSASTHLHRLSRATPLRKFGVIMLCLQPRCIGHMRL